MLGARQSTARPCPWPQPWPGTSLPAVALCLLCTHQGQSGTFIAGSFLPLPGWAVPVLSLLLSCSVVSDSFATPWTVAIQAPPLSMGFPRQEYWRRLPFPPPGDLPNPGVEPASPALIGRGDSLRLSHLGSPCCHYTHPFWGFPSY